MLRFILLMSVMFVLPFIVFHLWRMVGTPNDATPDDVPVTPTTWLTVIGAGLALVSALWLGLTHESEESGQGRYVPPTVVDGEVQPGRFEPDEGEVPEDRPDDPPDSQQNRD